MTMEIIERGKKYAEGKALSALSSVIEQAYIDGYNDGLKHLEIEKLEAMKEGVEYVDLDLPSGTLWSSRYVNDSYLSQNRLPQKNNLKSYVENVLLPIYKKMILMEYNFWERMVNQLLFNQYILAK